MEAQCIFTLIISTLLFIGGVFVLFQSMNHKTIIMVLLLILSGFFMSLTFSRYRYNKGQKDALAGKQKYEMHIDYHYEDSVLVPSDTFYFLIDSLKFNFRDLLPRPKQPVLLNHVIRPEKYNEYLRKVFIEGIIYVESRDSNTINHKENAVGYLQIRPIMIRDVNRIVGYKKFSLEDRWNRDKSIEIFVIYQDHYNPDWNLEKGARIWNGGPNGHNKESTAHYFEKLKERTPTLFS